MTCNKLFLQPRHKCIFFNIQSILQTPFLQHLYTTHSYRYRQSHISIYNFVSTNVITVASTVFAVIPSKVFLSSIDMIRILLTFFALWVSLSFTSRRKALSEASPRILSFSLLSTPVSIFIFHLIYFWWLHFHSIAFICNFSLHNT